MYIAMPLLPFTSAHHYGLLYGLTLDEERAERDGGCLQREKVLDGRDNLD